MKNVDTKELERRKRNIKAFKAIMIILDVLALILLVVQILIKDITYWSYVVLIICNILVFMVKIDEKESSKK